MLQKGSKFLTLKQPCEPTGLDAALSIAEAKNTLGILAVAVNTGGHSIRV